MSNELPVEASRPEPTALARADHTIGSSTIYRLCEEVIALREMNNRQHKLFEQALTKARDEIRSSFNSFRRRTPSGPTSSYARKSTAKNASASLS